MLASLGADASAPQTLEVAYLWPCNLPAWRHWQAVQTQWRMGPAGATGLDYTGVRAYFDLQGLKKPEQKDIFESIQAAERGTLTALAEITKKHKAP